MGATPDDLFGGNFGVMQKPETPILPEGYTLDQLGTAFYPVVREAPLPPPRTFVPHGDGEPDDAGSAEESGWVDIRTNEDIRRELQERIVNSLDLPSAIVGLSKESLTNFTSALRDYVMCDVVPLVLSIEPALTSVKQMVPKLFDNGEDLEVALPTAKIAAFAATCGTMAVRVKIMELLKLPEDVCERMTARMLPTEKDVRP